MKTDLDVFNGHEEKMRNPEYREAYEQARADLKASREKFKKCKHTQENRTNIESFQNPCEEPKTTS